MMTERSGTIPVHNKRGRLIVVCGPSGVGKGTVIKKYLEMNKDCVLSVSATTRPPREGEVNGREYYFMDRERFGELAAMGGMLEYAEYNGNYYGTPKSAVEEQLEAGRNVILEIEVQGFLKIRELKLDTVSVFIMPPNMEVLRQRLKDRSTDTPENMARRLRIAESEMEKAFLFDYIAINDDLDKCVGEISAIIAAAGCGARYREDFIKGVIKDAQTVDVSDY